MFLEKLQATQTSMLERNTYFTLSTEELGGPSVVCLQSSNIPHHYISNQTKFHIS